MLLAPAEFVKSPEALGKCWSLPDAQAYTRWLATHHYENFHVVSFLLPKALHQDFYNVYAYCRWADDLGDEIGDRARSLELLAWWRGELDAMYEGRTQHPVFVALADTVRRRQIPRQPFADLIDAFVQDQTVTRYQDWDDLFAYCRNSANPVGRLVLYLCGYSDDARQRLSDATCTALQLANFWQDVTVDLAKDRVYLPLSVLRRHGAPLDDLLALRSTPPFREAMREAVERARALFLEGLPLIGMVNRRLSLDLDLFSRGGLKVLEKIERQGYDVLAARPAISKVERVRLLAGSLARAAFAGSLMTEIDQSYAYCIRIARSRARNFYYSFVLLSSQQRKAMCAIYAFMRHCDDLSDEPGASRVALDEWRDQLEQCFTGRLGSHPLWPAFYHTLRRFDIPHDYLREMIGGVSSDLEPRRFETFDELYRYCYQVASVVGLTVVHIFGFDTPSALPLAEKCGIAFQLTNILRDIREDAERGRIYLPAEDLLRFGVTEEDLRAGHRTPEFVRLMQFEAARARAYYQVSQPLLDLIHPRSRPSLGALIGIYSRLLDRIESTNYDVFKRRVRLSAFEKSYILLRALWSRGQVLPSR